MNYPLMKMNKEGTLLRPQHTYYSDEYAHAMCDTALALRTMTDEAANYLWRNSDDTILGKKVFISEFMPDMESGSKPIAFGDFSYYWVICRSPVSVRALSEKFALLDQMGYLTFEFIDGKLIRPEVVKVIQMNTETNG